MRHVEIKEGIEGEAFDKTDYVRGFGRT